MASQVSVHCCLAASRPAERKSFVVERKQSCSSVAALLFWKIAEPGFLLLFPDRGIPTPSATWWLYSHLGYS